MELDKDYKDNLEKKYLKRMKRASVLDTKRHHSEYDKILLDLLNELGFDKITKEFNKYDFWYDWYSGDEYD